MRSIYLIKRGPQPDYHKMPYHPVILCTRRYTAQWEAGHTDEHAWVWEHTPAAVAGGWLLVRWNGFDIDYGIVRSMTMPDGTQAAFVHERGREPWTLLAGAVWWSDEPIPDWLSECGVRPPDDDFSQQRILDDAGICLLPPSQQMKVWARRDKQAQAGGAAGQQEEE